MFGKKSEKTLKKKGGVVTRFAPSPTGLLHVGNYRTALFAYLFARQHSTSLEKGKFILRIEDTDRERSKKEYEDNIIESLQWLGLTYDDFHRQSDRVAIHASYIQKLIDSGHAFISKETPKELGQEKQTAQRRSEVIRFKNPNKKVKWLDLIRGEIEFDTTDLGDFVIARSMTEPVFHLVVVVDDHEMGVTHIIRGEDHISNTPRHILLHEALGFALPTYAHLPLLLSPDRSKLSKRKGALPVTAYRDRGYLPEAIINYMALLGWNPGTEQEIFSIDELIRVFDLSKVQKSGAIFSEEKLNWINRQYMVKLSDDEFVTLAKKFVDPAITERKSFMRALPLIREKVSSFGEIKALFDAGGELSFIQKIFIGGASLPYKPESLMWKQEKNISRTKAHIWKVIELIHPLSQDTFTAETIKAAVWPYAEGEGKGNVLWPMRYALSGSEKSPDPFILGQVLGKNETIARLTIAHHAIK